MHKEPRSGASATDSNIQSFTDTAESQLFKVVIVEGHVWVLNLFCVLYSEMLSYKRWKNWIKKRLTGSGEAEQPDQAVGGQPT